MRRIAISVLVASGLMSRSFALAQDSDYRPLGLWTDPRVDAFNRWENLRQVQSDLLRPPVQAELRGLRSVSLLEAWLQTKRPRAVSNSNTARELILRLARRNPNLLKGELAEAMFLQRNPDWSPVSNPNAPHHDFTRPRLGGGPPENLQVKFHENGDPAAYIRDMKLDWRAHRVAIPDDHVPPVRASLNAEYRRLRALGDGASGVARDLGRLRGTGFTTEELIAQRRAEIAGAARMPHAGYISLGATLALTFGPTVWEAMNGRISGEEAAYRMTKATSLLGACIGTDFLLKTIGQGAIRGTLRGNLITGTAIEITDIIWNLSEHGWGRAFNNPDFYEETVGGISAISVSVATFGYVTPAASETGWWAPLIGIGASAITGSIAYIGGSSATRGILQLVAPDMLRRRERELLATTKSDIEQKIASLQKWPPDTPK
jgi:hypothetical protein